MEQAGIMLTTALNILQVSQEQWSFMGPLMSNMTKIWVQ